ncbi:3-phosphoglycerate dehydrogenase [Pandoraea terrae]|uniref:3-phosphoglycerate dehydrogenase n=1 Tax=Pandoraea terrae TaxID=1537710 RepID=A0A5E4Y5I2_9BURK|nr:D-2-hydroxyacid dehydrogenase [Pandoraea terrae]VVE43860.1 3-phosphoglycerate dehydrogenase [Pandoraea terrae]
MKVAYLVSLARSLVQEALQDEPFEIMPADNAAELAGVIAEADVFVTVGPAYTKEVADIVKQAKNLQLIQLTTAGFENLVKYGFPSTARVSNAADAWSIAVAEHAMALILALSRRIPDALRQQVEKRWERTYSESSLSLYGKTMAIVGYGRIGKAIAVRAKAFSMRVIAVSRTIGQDATVDEMVDAVDFCKAVSRADIVVAAMPSTPDTVGMFDRDAFSQFKQGALFINVARGDVANQADLEDALRSGKLVGAAVDVANPEPLPADDPFWSAPNLIITPHVAGFVSDLVPANIRDIVSDNLRRLKNGESLKNPVAFNYDESLMRNRQTQEIK